MCPMGRLMPLFQRGSHATRFVRGAVLLVGAVLVAGLPGPSWGAMELSRYGRTLVFAMGSDPETLSPAVTTGVEAVAVGCKMFTRFGSTRC